MTVKKSKKSVKQKKSSESSDQKSINRLNDSEKKVLKHNLEALLFAAGKSLTLNFLADLCKVTSSQAIKQLEELKKDYENSSVLMILQQDDSWKMTVREQYLEVVRKIVADTELSKTVLETLSMVAYKNPALQSDIVKARGVVTYDHIAELVRLGFIIKERIGRSYILKLSEKFYEYFELDGQKIKEVFQPVKDRIDEQLLLGNLKVINTNPSSETNQSGITSQDQSERLGELEVIRLENKENANKINSIRDGHRSFLDSIENQINEISKKTSSEEEDIQSIRESDVQNKINEIKLSESDNSDVVFELDDDSEDDDSKNSNTSDDFETDNKTIDDADDDTDKTNSDSAQNFEDNDNSDNSKLLDNAAKEIKALTNNSDSEEDKNE